MTERILLTTAEEWKSIIGWPGYEVSDFGQVRSFRVRGSHGPNMRFALEPVLCTPWVDFHGYLIVDFWFKGKRKHYRVNRLVAEAFIPNPLSKPKVNHIDGIKTNNGYTNLEWATFSEDIQHAYDTGLRLRGKGTRRTWRGLPRANYVG